MQTFAVFGLPIYLSGLFKAYFSYMNIIGSDNESIESFRIMMKFILFEMIILVSAFLSIILILLFKQL